MSGDGDVLGDRARLEGEGDGDGFGWGADA